MLMQILPPELLPKAQQHSPKNIKVEASTLLGSLHQVYDNLHP